MKALNITTEQVEILLGSLVINYYRTLEISKKGNLADTEIWEAIAANILNLSEEIEIQTGVKTFGANSFKSQI
jgi:hypothetical protein